MDHKGYITETQGYSALKIQIKYRLTQDILHNAPSNIIFSDFQYCIQDYFDNTEPLWVPKKIG